MTLDAGYSGRSFRSILTSVLFVWLAVVPMASLHAQVVTASSGRDFWVALPSIALGPGYLVRLNITAVQGADVTVTLTENDSTITRSLSAGELWELILPRSIVMLDLAEYTSRRSIHITSTQPVTAHLISDASYVSEAFCALPTPSLGFEYLVMSAPSVGFPSDEQNSFGGMMAVIATQDGTELRITPTVMTTSGNPAGFTYGVSLRRGEVYQMLPRNPDHTDLTGTRITSNRPIGVLSGHRFLEYDSLDASNPLLEQMVPLVDWGRTFYAAPLPPGTYGHYRILASRSGTEVFINGRRVATLGAGESRRIAAEGAIVIRASAPVLIAQHTTTFPAEKGEPDSDPSMMLLNPVESYTESFVWGTSALSPRLIPADTLAVPFRQYAMITAPTNERNAVRLDGAPINFTIVHNDGAYYTAVVQLTPGAHQLSAPVPVNAQLYGNSLDDAYSLPAGIRLRDPFRADPLYARTCRDFLDTTILLSNVGTEQIDVTDISFSSGLTASVLSPDFLPINILPATSQPLRVRIALPTYGTFSGTMTVTTATSGARPLVVPIEVTRDSLAIRTIESDVRFGDVTVSRPSRDTTVRVINTGTGPVQISGTMFNGPFTIVSPQLPRWLAPGDTLLLMIRFAPLGPGSFDGNMTVIPAPCGDAVTVTLHGTRLRPAQIDATVDLLEPLVCPVPGYQDIPLTVRNAGEEPLRIDSIGVGGVDAADFFFPNSPNGAVVPPRDSLVLLVRFMPRSLSRRDRNAELRIWNPISPPGYFFLPVSARKDSLGVVISQYIVDFGTLNGCQSEASQTISLRNSGNVSVTLDSLLTSTGDFAVDAGPVTLEPDASTDLVIRFTPQGNGERHDTLRLVDARCHIVTEVILTGNQQAADLRIEQDTMDIGVIPSCTLPYQFMLRVTNRGGVAERITSVETDHSVIAIGNIPDSTLDPSQTLSIPLTLQPASNGEVVARVTLRAEPCDLDRHAVIRAILYTPVMVQPDDVDLGELAGGVPGRGATVVVNSGLLPLRIDSISIVPPVSGLRIINPSLPAVIQPGDSLRIEFDYTQDMPRSIASRAIVYSTMPCVASTSFGIYGHPEKNIAIVLSLPDTVASVDSRITLPIILSGAQELEGQLIVTGDVRWNYTMLQPEEILTPVTGATVTLLRDTVMGADRIVSFKYVGPTPRDTVLAMLTVRSLLGTDDTTALQWGTVVLQTGESVPEVETVDGSFSTLGICRIGGDRFVRLRGVTAVSKPAPNPASTVARLEVTATESLSCTLRIVDYLGREVSSVQTLQLQPGRQQIELDLHELRSGTYLYELGDGYRTERGWLMITR